MIPGYRSGRICGFTFTRQAAILLWLSLCLLLSRASHAQTYYYFECKAKNAPDTFYTFLQLSPDGHATARVRAKEPSSKREFIFEISLKDSVPETSATTDIALYGVKEPELIIGMTDQYFFNPVFIFKMLAKGADVVYVPKEIRISTAAAPDIPCTVLKSMTWNDESLRTQTALVKSFYTEEEPFYIYVMEGKKRAIPKPRKENMFLIVVANTLDPTIGSSSKKDFDNITTLFTRLAADLGIQQVNKTYIQGDQFSKAVAERAIAALKPAPADIVVFYFTGHGFRYSDDTSTYARMSFRTKLVPTATDNNLSLEDVADRIKKTKPGLSLVIADCCNEDIGATPRKGSGLLTTKGLTFNNVNIDNASKLFFPPVPSSVIIGAAGEKQFSVCNPAVGGFFTYFFTSALYQKVYGFHPVQPEWWSVIISANDLTRQKALTAQCGDANARCIQTPVFAIDPPL